MLCIWVLDKTLIPSPWTTHIGVANGTAKNVSRGKFCPDLKISEAFMISLEVSFFHGLFLLFWVSKLFTKESRARISNWDLGVSASLGFYHSPPLHMDYPKWTTPLKFSDQG